MRDMSLENTILNFGLAGAVILLFYKLICNELKDLKDSINRLTNKIEQLIATINK